MQLRRRKSAFSLVELIVVMVIIGLLASLAAIRTRSYLIASKQNAAKLASSPMITMTTINSTNENALLRRRSCMDRFLYASNLRNISSLQDRQYGGQEKKTHRNGKDKNHDWFDKSRDASRRRCYLFIVVGRKFLQHFV